MTSHESGVETRRHPRRSRRICGAIAGFAVVTMAVAACSSGGGSSSSNNNGSSSNGSSGSGSDSSSLVSVKIGYPLPNIFSVAMQLGVKEGIFKQNGLNVSAVSLGTSPVVNSALAGGSVDYAIDTTAAILPFYKQGAGVEIIGNYTTGIPLEVIVSNQFAGAHHLSFSSNPDTTVHDLIGATIGVSSPVVEAQEDLLLKGYGVASSQVKNIVVSSESTLAQQLKSNQIDAFIASPPVDEEAAADGAGVIVINETNAPPWRIDDANLVVTANKSYSDAHPTVSKEIVTAIAESVKWLLGNQNEAASDSTSILTGTTTSQLMEGFKIAGYTSCPVISAKEWAATLSFLTATKTITSSNGFAEGGVWTNEYTDGSCT